MPPKKRVAAIANISHDQLKHKLKAKHQAAQNLQSSFKRLLLDLRKHHAQKEKDLEYTKRSIAKLEKDLSDCKAGNHVIATHAQKIQSETQNRRNEQRKLVKEIKEVEKEINFIESRHEVRSANVEDLVNQLLQLEADEIIDEEEMWKRKEDEPFMNSKQSKKTFEDFENEDDVELGKSFVKTRSSSRR